MFVFLIILLILDAALLMAVVLLQSGKGGGLAAVGGGASTETFFGGRQAATLLHTLSWWAGGIFLALALILTAMSSRGGAPRSVLEGQLGAPAPVTLPIEGVEPAAPAAGQGTGEQPATPAPQTPPPGKNP